VAGFFIWAICGHRYHLNGTPYHRWIWRNSLGDGDNACFLALAVPFFLGQWIYLRRPDAVRTSLGLVMVCSLV